MSDPSSKADGTRPGPRRILRGPSRNLRRYGWSILLIAVPVAVFYYLHVKAQTHYYQERSLRALNEAGVLMTKRLGSLSTTVEQIASISPGKEYFNLLKRWSEQKKQTAAIETTLNANSIQIQKLGREIASIAAQELNIRDLMGIDRGEKDTLTAELEKIAAKKNANQTQLDTAIAQKRAELTKMEKELATKKAALDAAKAARKDEQQRQDHIRLLENAEAIPLQSEQEALGKRQAIRGIFVNNVTGLLRLDATQSHDLANTLTPILSPKEDLRLKKALSDDQLSAIKSAIEKVMPSAPDSSITSAPPVVAENRGTTLPLIASAITERIEAEFQNLKRQDAIWKQEQESYALQASQLVRVHNLLEKSVVVTKSDEQMSALEKEIAAVTETINDLKSSLEKNLNDRLEATKDHEHETLQKKIDELDTSIASFNAELESLKQRKIAIQKQRDDLAKQQDSEKPKLDEIRANLVKISGAVSEQGDEVRTQEEKWQRIQRTLKRNPTFSSLRIDREDRSEVCDKTHTTLPSVYIKNAEVTAEKDQCQPGFLKPTSQTLSTYQGAGPQYVAKRMTVKVELKTLLRDLRERSEFDSVAVAGEDGSIFYTTETMGPMAEASQHGANSPDYPTSNGHSSSTYVLTDAKALIHRAIASLAAKGPKKAGSTGQGNTVQLSGPYLFSGKPEKTGSPEKLTQSAILEAEFGRLGQVIMIQPVSWVPPKHFTRANGVADDIVDLGKPQTFYMIGIVSKAHFLGSTFRISPLQGTVGAVLLILILCALPFLRVLLGGQYFSLGKGGAYVLIIATVWGTGILFISLLQVAGLQDKNQAYDGAAPRGNTAHDNATTAEATARNGTCPGGSRDQNRTDNGNMLACKLAGDVSREIDDAKLYLKATDSAVWTQAGAPCECTTTDKTVCKAINRYKDTLKEGLKTLKPDGQGDGNAPYSSEYFNTNIVDMGSRTSPSRLLLAHDKFLKRVGKTPDRLFLPPYDIVGYFDVQGEELGPLISFRHRTFGKISIASRRYLQQAAMGQSYGEAGAGRAERYTIERVANLSDGSYSVILARPTGPKHSALLPNPDIGPGVEIIGFESLALKSPVLPRGYKFAVVHDTSGIVIAHSMRSPVLVENFIHEADDDGALANVIARRMRTGTQGITGRYHGEPATFYAYPVKGTPWVTVIIRDNRLHEEEGFLELMTSVGIFTASTLGFAILLALSFFAWRTNSLSWILMADNSRRTRALQALYLAVWLVPLGLAVYTSSGFALAGYLLLPLGLYVLRPYGAEGAIGPAYKHRTSANPWLVFSLANIAAALAFWVFSAGPGSLVRIATASGGIAWIAAAFGGFIWIWRREETAGLTGHKLAVGKTLPLAQSTMSNPGALCAMLWVLVVTSLLPAGLSFAVTHHYFASLYRNANMVHALVAADQRHGVIRQIGIRVWGERHGNPGTPLDDIKFSDRLILQDYRKNIGILVAGARDMPSTSSVSCPSPGDSGPAAAPDAFALPSWIVDRTIHVSGLGRLLWSSAGQNRICEMGAWYRDSEDRTLLHYFAFNGQKAGQSIMAPQTTGFTMASAPFYLAVLVGLLGIIWLFSRYMFKRLLGGERRSDVRLGAAADLSPEALDRALNAGGNRHVIVPSGAARELATNNKAACFTISDIVHWAATHTAEPPGGRAPDKTEGKKGKPENQAAAAKAQPLDPVSQATDPRAKRERCYLTGLDSVVDDAAAREAALDALERFLIHCPMDVILISDQQVLYRLVRPDAYGDPLTSIAPPSSTECKRWANLLAQFVKMGAKDMETVSDAENQAASSADDDWLLRTVRDRELSLIRSHPSVLEVVEPKLVTDGNMSVEDMVDIVGYYAGPIYRALWAQCTFSEKVVLHHLAQGRLVNTDAHEALEHIYRRGLVILDPQPRIVCASFAHFILNAERPETFAYWEQALSHDTWSALKIPLFVTIILFAAILFNNAQQEMEATIAALSSALVLLPQLLSGFRLFQGNAAPHHPPE